MSCMQLNSFGAEEGDAAMVSPLAPAKVANSGVHKIVFDESV